MPSVVSKHPVKYEQYIKLVRLFVVLNTSWNCLTQQGDKPGHDKPLVGHVNRVFTHEFSEQLFVMKNGSS